MRRGARATPLVGLLLAACPAEAPHEREPGVYVVAPRGSDRGPGTPEHPWASLEHAARVAGPGDRVLVRGGTYYLRSTVRPRRSGTPDAWIVFAAQPGEEVVLDASSIAVAPPLGGPPFAHDQGAFQLEGIAYVRVRGLTLRRSRKAGFTVRDSHHVELLDNTTDTTFASGIAVWDSEHDDAGTEQIVIRGNTVIRANTWGVHPRWALEVRPPPHEAISLGGAQHFEVSHNHVHHGGKEGIDVKETSKHGSVHHNHVHHMARQGLYVDGWHAPLRDVELAHNVVHDCHGAGVVISVENGPSVEDLRIHHNAIYDNDGTGLYFSRWGDGPRRRIEVDHNTLHHNGHGPPAEGQRYHWITGGIHLFSGNVEDLRIHHNVLSDNRGFQIGVGRYLLEGELEVEEALARHRITLEHNVVDRGADDPVPVEVGESIEADSVVPIVGAHAITATPRFVDAAAGDLRLRPGSPGLEAGATADEVPGASLPPCEHDPLP